MSRAGSVARGRFPRQAEEIAERERAIQSKMDAKEGARARASKGARPQPMQAGARVYPAPPLPKHLAKPGPEADFESAPIYVAPGEILPIIGGYTGG